MLVDAVVTTAPAIQPCYRQDGARDNLAGVKPDMVALGAFVCGLGGYVQIRLVGELYVAEFLLPIYTLLLVLFRGDAGALSRGFFWAILGSGMITLLGYALSDLWVGTAAAQYLRGWGRVLLMLSDALCLIVIVSHGRKNLWWFILGLATGGLFYLWLSGLPLSAWKRGFAEPATQVFLLLLPLLPPVARLPCLAVYGFANLAMDYRSLGAAIFLILGLRLGRTKGGRLRIGVTLRIGFVLGLVASVLYAGLMLTSSEYGDRREASNVGRSAGIVVGLRAIADSPLIGYGSWTISEEYAKQLRGVIEENRDAANRLGNQGQGDLFRSHSQIIQAWVEGGFLATAFFFMYFAALVSALIYMITRRTMDALTFISFYFLILGGWHWLASPFGGDKRLFIAVAIGIITMTLSERRALRCGRNALLE